MEVLGRTAAGTGDRGGAALRAEGRTGGGDALEEGGARPRGGRLGASRGDDRAGEICQSIVGILRKFTQGNW